MDELSQLDELMESDILDALGENPSEIDISNDNDEIQISDFDDELLIEDFNESEPEISNENDSIQEINLPNAEKENDTSKIISQSTTGELANLLSQLLNNKTIEITIKIKD